MEEVIELEYPQGVGAGLFASPHEDVPAPTAETPAEAQEMPSAVVIVDCEGSSDCD